MDRKEEVRAWQCDLYLWSVCKTLSLSQACSVRLLCLALQIVLELHKQGAGSECEGIKHSVIPAQACSCPTVVTA